MNRAAIPVTMPFRPPLREYLARLKSVWDSGIMTHNGPLVQQLEAQLARRFRFRNVACVTNGTMALQLAIRALRLKGEIITSPFTYAATACAIAWEGCRPVFADIDEATLNIDPRKIEERITRRTGAILGVHVFSNPCDIEAIGRIARRHRLKVIYDAAHAVAVDWKGKSLLEQGDVSAFSLHATKLLNCAEGGGCVSRDRGLVERVKRMRFFGHDDAKEVVDEGTNAKMHEVTAALGLTNLKWLGRVLKNRRVKYTLYQVRLASAPGLRFQSFPRESYNYSYMPVIFDSGRLRAEVDGALRAGGVLARRYFHPSLNTTKPYRQPGLPVSERVADRVLCLPLYDDLPDREIERICRIIRKAL